MGAGQDLPEAVVRGSPCPMRGPGDARHIVPEGGAGIGKCLRTRDPGLAQCRPRSVRDCQKKAWPFGLNVRHAPRRCAGSLNRVSQGFRPCGAGVHRDSGKLFRSEVTGRKPCGQSPLGLQVLQQKSHLLQGDGTSPSPVSVGVTDEERFKVAATAATRAATSRGRHPDQAPERVRIDVPRTIRPGAGWPGSPSVRLGAGPSNGGRSCRHLHRAASGGKGRQTVPAGL
jgi:hypothetical protein